jgi:hypothetical protein
MVTPRRVTDRGKTAVTTHAADIDVSGMSAACQQPVRRPVSGTVSGRSNQKPYKAANFSALVVYVGTH